jgi:hypothetical protein
MTNAAVMRATNLFASSAIALITLIWASSASAFDYKPVTDERLANPEPETGCSIVATIKAGAIAR